MCPSAQNRFLILSQTVFTSEAEFNAFVVRVIGASGAQKHQIEFIGSCRSAIDEYDDTTDIENIERRNSSRMKYIELKMMWINDL